MFLQMGKNAILTLLSNNCKIWNNGLTSEILISKIKISELYLLNWWSNVLYLLCQEPMSSDFTDNLTSKDEMPWVQDWALSSVEILTLPWILAQEKQQIRTIFIIKNPINEVIWDTTLPNLFRWTSNHCMWSYAWNAPGRVALWSETELPFC